MSIPVALFVGATNGIGAALAVRFARAVPKAQIVILGRNETAAETVLKALRAQNDSISADFVKLDCSDLQAVRTFCTDFCSSHSQLNYLCLSAGIMSMKMDPTAAEGVDRKLILHYYSRMLFIKGLLPLLQKSKAEAAPCVLNVLAAGDEGTVNWSDLPLKQPDSWSLRYCAAHAVTLTSLMTQELGEAYPDIRWTHAHPGFVNTNLSNSMPWYLKGPMMAASVFASKPEVSAERLIGNLVPSKPAATAVATGPFYFNWRGNQIQTQGAWLTEENRRLAKKDLELIIGGDPTKVD